MLGANLTNLFTGGHRVEDSSNGKNRFYWGALDYQWYPEACMSSGGFNTVQDFITPKYSPMASNEDGQSLDLCR